MATEIKATGRGNKQAERSALSDKLMFDAAVQLINERGTAKTTLKDIGEVAGYSRGLASYRFGSKDGLWMELFDKFDDLWKAHIGGYVRGKRGIEAIKSAIAAQRDIFKNESNYLRAMYILWYESLGDESEIRASLARHHVIYRRDITRWIEEGLADGSISDSVDPANFATTYCSTMFGTIYQWVVAPDSVDLDDFFDHIEKMMLFYITKARHN
ncbi:MAG: hypothetical protein RLZZ602_943 [Pseudomonadota bacterium]